MRRKQPIFQSHRNHAPGTVMIASCIVAISALAGCNQTTANSPESSTQTAVAGDSAAKSNESRTDLGQRDHDNTKNNGDDKKMELATFGGGCFWGVELTFSKQEGVIETDVGFMGGKVDKPTYQAVCYTDTGHAEVVHLKFDPAVISYDDLLDVFWKIHDPTQVNRQGLDIGTQYRTVIFYHNDEQRDKAEASKKALDAAGKFSKPIATLIEPAETFWKAEEYHQDYLKKKGVDSCHLPNG